MDSPAPPESLSPDPLATEDTDFGSETLAQAEGIAEANTQFAAGDFVWAKATGRPWWPALVSSQTRKDSVLVACFGDEDALAWCEPKQLKPFLEMFDEMSRQSSSKSFLSALHSCVEEIERNLELQLTCHCVPFESRSYTLGGEAGKGLSMANFSPNEFQERLMDAATNVKDVNALEAARLRCWVFAFGKVFMEWGSWVFHRRRGIEDLVDKIDLDALPVEMVSSKEEEEAVIDASIGKRRRRSMSKLIAEMDLDLLEVDDDDEKEEQSSRSKRCRSKGKVEVVKAEEEHDSSSVRRERKKSKYLSPPYTNLREVGKFLAMLPRKGCSFSDHGATVSSAYKDEEDDTIINMQKIEKMPAAELFSEFLSTAENSLHLKGNRAAKVIKYFFAIDRDSKFSGGTEFEDYQKLVHESFARSEDSVEDSEKQDGSTGSFKSGAYKGNNVDVMHKKTKNKSGIDQKNKLDSELPKRNLKNGGSKQQKSGRLEKQKPRRKTFLKDGTSLGAPIYLDFCNSNALDAGRGKQKNQKNETQLNSDLNPESNASSVVKEKQKLRRKMLKDATSKGAPANLDLNMEDSLGEFKYGKGNKRSRNDENGESSVPVDLQLVDCSDNSVCLAVEPINCQEGIAANEQKVRNKKDANGKALQKSCYTDARFAELAKSVLKKKNSLHPKAKPGKKKVKGVDPVYSRHAALHLTFNSGVDLPCVEDLITTYSKYGALIDSRIELFEDLNSALVVFTNAADAENAFKDRAGPYGSVATFRLHYLADNAVDPSESNHDSASPSLHIYDISPLQQIDQKSPVHKPPLPYIRKSLATMISTLALSSSSPINNAGVTADGLKPEARENLVGEMQGLLQKVDKMLNGAGSASST